MKDFFFYFGVLSFIVVCVGLTYLLYPSFSSIFYEVKRKYNDHCYLNNLGWTEKDFDNFMATTRKEMTDEQYKEWEKKNVRFWYSWICFKKKKS